MGDIRFPKVEAKLAYVRLNIQQRPAGDFRSPWTTFATGATTGSNIFLGSFDPTLLLNGLYDIQLVALDLAGQEVTTAPVTVAVTDNLKIGQFTLAFTDRADSRVRAAHYPHPDLRQP